MAWSREAIEGVLRSHMGAGKYAVRNLLPYAELRGQYEELISDFLALRPEPSREALHVIFEQHYSQHQSHHVGASLHRSVCCWKSGIEDLLAWARGEPERQWCPHLSYESSTDRWVFSSAGERWVVKDRWLACPLCGTPRPPED